MRLYRSVARLAIRVNGPPESVFHAIDRDHNLVEMPLARSTWPIATNTVGEIGAKPVYPQPNGPQTDATTPRSRKILDLRRAEGEALASPDGMGNDLAGETQTFQARPCQWRFHGQPLQ